MKRLLLCLALGLIGSGAFAQGIGLRAGATFNNNSFSAKDGFKSESVTGLQAGLVVDIPIIDLVGLQVEALFDQRGYKSTEPILPGLDAVNTYTLNYATIPFMANVKIPLVGGLKLAAHAGPYVSMGFSGTQKTDALGSSNSKSVEFTNTYSASSKSAQFSLVDYGVMGGLGVRYTLVKGFDLFADGRYTMGLAELGKYDKDNTPVSSSDKAFRELEKSALRQVNVSLGVLFVLGGND